MTTTTELDTFLAEARERTNAALERWCHTLASDRGDRVAAAIAYSLRSPGKRFRPALLLAVHRELGGAGDAADLAAAVEVVHTYSLVHDDLPCMDDDDLRRGRPTTHRAFDVPTAVAAGVAMVPLAARVLAAGAEGLGLSNERSGAMGIELFRAAGATGMIGGQMLDLEAEGRDVMLPELRDIHRRKTGALIEASAVIGALAAGADDGCVAGVRGYGQELGVAFQIADDVLDATATSDQLGKTAGKDARQRKATFAALLGTDEAMTEARERIAAGVDRLGGCGIHSPLLQALAHFIVDRRF